MSLGIDYCKEIAKELQLIPVYLPGMPVAPGDIIGFSKTTFFGAPKPIGSFRKRGNLTDLGINLDIEDEDDDAKDSYVYASKGGVDVSFNADANAGDIGSGKLTIGFKKEGATYLSAVDCRVSRFKSILNLPDLLEPHNDKLHWEDFFIVIGVTVASKALIMQSNTKTASLEIEGSVKNLVPTGTIVKDLDAGISLKISSYKEASFIKDWSSNVPVFFQLIRYKKGLFGSWSVGSQLSTLKQSGGEAVAKQTNPYYIDHVNSNELTDYTE